MKVIKYKKKWKYFKFWKIPRKIAEKIRENPGKSGKIRENPGKSGKIRENQDTFPEKEILILYFRSKPSIL